MEIAYEMNEKTHQGRGTASHKITRSNKDICIRYLRGVKHAGRGMPAAR